MSVLSVSIARVAGLLVVMSMILAPATTLAAPPEVGETIHIVKLGETLSGIADRYGVTVDAIMAANNLTNPNFIYVGQRLIIPAAWGGPGWEGRRDEGRHVVQAGETLTSIALRYGTTVAALAAANGLRNADFIYVGQVLNVPIKATREPRPGQAPAPGPVSGGCARDSDGREQRPCAPTGKMAAPPSGPANYYTVSAGDTLASIAARFGVSEADLLRANNLPSSASIYVGLRLVIPGVAVSVPPGYTAAPAPPPAYQAAPATVSTAQALPPGYTLPTATAPSIPAGIFVVPATQLWIGSQTASNADPDGITTLLVMTHDAKDLDMMIYSTTGFAARGVSGVYFEYSWIPTFAFRGIPGGDYQVWISGKPSQLVTAHVDPGFRTLVEFHYTVASIDSPPSPSGWIGEVTQNSSGVKPLGVASILVIRTGAIGNKIRVTAGTYEGVCITGTKIELGPGACEIGGLTAGTYRVFLDGTDIAVDVYLDGVGTATVEFRHT